MKEYEAFLGGSQAAGSSPTAPEPGILPLSEPGMNFISADYDLIMVNRTNERIYGKPVATLLGKKCYREFERREEPCPHCPGKLALATGETHETESVTWHGDGTRVYVRIRAHPVLGPDNNAQGFIEVVEDLTDQRRAESIAAIESDLETALLSSKNITRALRETLEAALRIECLEWGCVFLADRATGAQGLVHQRGVTPEQIAVLEPMSHLDRPPLPSELPGGSLVVEILPIMHRGTVVARLIAGGATCRVMPGMLKAGLRSLGVLTGNAISRIIAEQSRGDAVADLEAFIGIAPVPTWVLDSAGRVTMWNKAAEKTLGWQAGEVVGHLPPFGAVHEDPQPAKIALKDGGSLDLCLVSAPFRDVVGNASTVLVMADMLDAASRCREPLAAGSTTTAGDADSRAGGATRVLIVDFGEPWGGELSEIMSALGYLAVRCHSAVDAAGLVSNGETGCRPFDLAVVAMIYANGQSGLDQKSALRSLGLKSPVMVSSDSGVHGHEHYGIASVITKPFSASSVAKAMAEALPKHL
jgi:PAS domain S-box-containing protein